MFKSWIDYKNQKMERAVEAGYDWAAGKLLRGVWHVDGIKPDHTTLQHDEQYFDIGLRAAIADWKKLNVPSTYVTQEMIDHFQRKEESFEQDFPIPAPDFIDIKNDPDLQR